MRAIVDTNLLIAALLWRGPPHRLLEHARGGVLTLVSSPTLIAELEEVLAREKFSTILARASLSREHALEQLRQLIVVVDAPPLSVPVCRDPDDDHVLAVACAAGADSIITGDHDLLALSGLPGHSHPHRPPGARPTRFPGLIHCRGASMQKESDT